MSIQKGIYGDLDRTLDPYDTIIDLLYLETHISTDCNKNQKGVRIDMAGNVNTQSDKPPNTVTNDEQYTQVKHVEAPHRTAANPYDDPDGDNSSSSSEDDYCDKMKQRSTLRQYESNDESSPKQKPTPQMADEQNVYSLGVKGMMNAFMGQDKLEGNYEDDLERTLNICETVTDTCDAAPQQMRKSMPVIICAGNAAMEGTKIIFK